jgi:hypothetical protein
LIRDKTLPEAIMHQQNAGADKQRESEGAPHQA